ncbi:MAG: hypothetical protein JJ974_01610 [Phycisphaerales bacterium]|nr:hypothetical protein [Phycisphaerales bacterium]
MKSRDRITTTLDSSLIERIDRVAEFRNESRSATIDRMLANGIEDEEKMLESIGVGVQGRIIALLIENPKILNSLSKAVGEALTDEQLASIEESGSDVIAAGKRYRNYKKTVVEKGKK